MKRCAAVAAATLLAACGDDASGPAAGAAGRTDAATAEVWFEDVRAASGVDFVHQSGFDGRYWFPEITCGGVAVFDADGDGRLDLYFVQGGAVVPDGRALPGNRLYRNLGDMRFEDVTELAGVGDTGYGMGAACGDVDGDGDTDLFVTNLGADVLYLNRGDGTFEDATAASGLDDDGWGSSAGFLDHDGDGDLDLFIVRYVGWSPLLETLCPAAIDESQPDYCPPIVFEAPLRDRLYANRGDGTFEDVSAAAGLEAAFGNGLGLGLGDFDGDGRVDVYVANDGTVNQLWINRGEGRFEDRALIAGCALNESGHAEAGMGVVVVDLDQDDDLDLFLTHLRGQTNTLYRNEGRGFADRTALFGLAAESLPFTGFGVAVADFDRDAARDVYVANGRVSRELPILDPAHPYAEPDLLFAGSAPATAGAPPRFRVVTPAGGVVAGPPETGRALAWGDLDDDGGVDLVVVNRDAPPFLLRSVRGADARWIGFRPLDARGAVAHGARVTIDFAGRTAHGLAQPCQSYQASVDPRVHFGLGSHAGPVDVRVVWPDGAVERFGPREPGRYHDLVIGAGE